MTNIYSSVYFTVIVVERGEGKIGSEEGKEECVCVCVVEESKHCVENIGKRWISVSIFIVL